MTAVIPTEAAVTGALMVWFEQYGELGDLMAEQAEDTEGDPTLDDAVRDQLENCVDLAAQVIALLGKHILDNAKGSPIDPATALADDGSEYVKPPF